MYEKFMDEYQPKICTFTPIESNKLKLRIRNGIHKLKVKYKKRGFKKVLKTN